MRATADNELLEALQASCPALKDLLEPIDAESMHEVVMVPVGQLERLADAVSRGGTVERSVRGHEALRGAVHR